MGRSHPFPNQGAKTMARRIVYNFIAPWLEPPLSCTLTRVRTLTTLCLRVYTKYCRSQRLSHSPYHSASNGQLERFNRTLLQMIRCYVDQSQKNWDEHLSLLTSAYCSSQHAVTEFTPNKLIFGREIHQGSSGYLVKGCKGEVWLDGDDRLSLQPDRGT